MIRVLIIKTGALEDVLRTTCILPGLHTKYRDIRISWLTSNEAIPLICNNSLINVVFTANDLATIECHRDEFNLVINLEDSSCACEFASMFPRDYLIGPYSENGIIQYDRKSAIWFDMSLISQQGRSHADNLKQTNNRSYPSLLFEMLDRPAGRPSLALSDSNQAFARKFSRYQFDGTPVIGLNTGASNRWRYKRLSEEKTANLISTI